MTYAVRLAVSLGVVVQESHGEGGLDGNALESAGALLDFLHRAPDLRNSYFWTSEDYFRSSL